MRTPLILALAVPLAGCSLMGLSDTNLAQVETIILRQEGMMQQVEDARGIIATLGQQLTEIQHDTPQHEAAVSQIEELQRHIGDLERRIDSSNDEIANVEAQDSEQKTESALKWTLVAGGVAALYPQFGSIWGMLAPALQNRRRRAQLNQRILMLQRQITTLHGSSPGDPKIAQLEEEIRQIQSQIIT